MAQSPRNRWLLAIILAIALATRLTWVVTRPADDASIDQLPDQREYLELARNLLHGEGLSFTDPRFTDRIYAYRTPGYPAFIAACGANVRAVCIAQAMIDTLTVLAAYILARRWCTESACVFAAALVALNPFLIYFTGTLLTETLFTAMLAWGLVLITSLPLLPWLGGCAILALSILVRPGALILPLVLAVLAAIANRRAQQSYQRRWPLPVGTTMLLFILIVLTPWAWRNHQRLGAWVWTTTNGGITAYDGFNANATGASDQSFVAAMPQLKRMSEIERDQYLQAQANEFRRENAWASLELAMKKLARTWSPRPLSEQFSRPAYLAAAMAYSIPFDVLVLLGLLSAPQPHRAAKLLLVAPAIYLSAAAMLSVGSLRYRIPAEVPMAILAAAGLETILAPSQRDGSATQASPLQN